MSERDWANNLVLETIGGLAKCWACPMGANTEKGINLAGQQAAHEVLEDLVAILFPGCHGHEPVAEKELNKYLQQKLKSVTLSLKEQAVRAFKYQCTVDKCEDCDDCDQKAHDAVLYLVKSLSVIQKILQRDIVAAYEGDPAARSTMEIVMSYPGLYAIIVHRIAHLLYEKDVPLIPRIMSEYAHSRTGIDIHPGADIGAGFFIDHGTGVVIGETSVIGENVKLYQGVTLGAVSFEKDEQGNPVKGIKRHPDVGDNVVIYAEATILGNVSIGANSVIGGNVWLTHSVPPDSKVSNQQPRPLIRETDGTWKTANGPWDDFGAGI
ncbi:serine O-acetyltransferase EpsC [Verrucomicrobiota bacterium]